MNERERIIRLWFDMWLCQKDLGIDEIFTEDVTYIESWGPKYTNRSTVKHWFEEWNTRGKVYEWDIKQYFHRDSQTVVEWYFRNKMSNGEIEEFDGVSLVEWTEENKICFLKELVCNRISIILMRMGINHSLPTKKQIGFRGERICIYM